MSARAPKRDGIGRESKWEKQETLKKKEMIASSKRRKVKEEGGQVRNTFPTLNPFTWGKVIHTSSLHLKPRLLHMILDAHLTIIFVPGG